MKSLFAFLLIVVATSLTDELHAQDGETTATISSRVHEHAETTTLAKALDAAGLTVALFLPKHADALIALLPYYLIDSADHPSTAALTEVRNG
ncbi:hypothetical protein [Lewinella sp. IMCC34191]|uniref:hypothetical protein n=1 Tax=Lewinella sp. IMCC34191 TaxID=2259172 RepID=UPI000E27C917|nr:hypothetical protein [Lewinella sp. IMCC34191]